MLTLQNGNNTFSITFQHYPTKQERDEYQERRKAAIAEGKPAPRPPREHRKTVCRIWELADNPEGTPRMVNATLRAEGCVRQYTGDEYNREVARRQSLMKALHIAFPGSESDNPANRQLRIQAWDLYWKTRQEALSSPLPKIALGQYVGMLHRYFVEGDGSDRDELEAKLREDTETLYHIIYGPHKESNHVEPDSQAEQAQAAE